jgi:hypothetical protein
VLLSSKLRWEVLLYPGVVGYGRINRRAGEGSGTSAVDGRGKHSGAWRGAAPFVRKLTTGSVDLAVAV